jgi:regulator of sigma D
LEEFCQLLIDYTAFGYFEVFTRIQEGNERRGQVHRLADRIYSTLADVTAVTVAFNDKYDASTHHLELDGLSRDLSLLGEQLATRLELEDRLLKALAPPPPGSDGAG